MGRGNAIAQNAGRASDPDGQSVASSTELSALDGKECNEGVVRSDLAHGGLRSVSDLEW